MLCDVFPYFSQRVGVTTTLPDSVPGYLPIFGGAGGHEWNYDDRSLYHNGSYSGTDIVGTYIEEVMQSMFLQFPFAILYHICSTTYSFSTQPRTYPCTV